MAGRTKTWYSVIDWKWREEKRTVLCLLVAELPLLVHQLDSDSARVGLVPLWVSGIVLVLHLRLEAGRPNETIKLKFCRVPTKKYSLLTEADVSNFWTGWVLDGLCLADPSALLHRHPRVEIGRIHTHPSDTHEITPHTHVMAASRADTAVAS